MLRIYQYIQFWLKAANSKGHGTHSPFVYNFIINVLNDKRHFYCYEYLGHQNKKFDTTNLKKVDELLFRITNYYEFENITAINTNATTASYLNAANANADVHFAINKINTKQLIYIEEIKGAINGNNLLECCANESFIIINQQHNSEAKYNLWQELVTSKNILLTIDLFHISIAVINTNFKEKQHFNIRY